MLLAVFLVGLIGSVYGAGELSVIHHPGSLVFKGHDSLKESALPEVYSAALGLSTEQFSHWQGFYIENPFNIPEAIVTIAIDGVQDIGQNNGHHYPLLTNEDESQVFNILSRKISERYVNEKPTLIRIDFSNGLDDIHQYEIFNGIKRENPKSVTHKHLKVDLEEDRNFLKDIALLHEIAAKIEAGAVKEDFIPDVYWFSISSLHALSDLHGSNATETQEAKQLLQEAIATLSNAFIKHYSNHVLVTVITSDASHTRLRRNVLATTLTNYQTDKTLYNLASTYSSNYPAIFNIILWFCVAMFFSILAICYVTANMDPGRDSIIYRMTSTRMKKDN
ncbi:ATPase H(+)-transporting accessory protein 2 [Euwallacea fornicatus]|uniref:ATPase H(+)-transporting accessory protein 2 n=1 Tax=Euwallacea fornicatus TaxID=995702 RepID=UPI00338EB4FA